MTKEEAAVAEGNPDIRRIAEKFAPEVVYLHVVDLETRVARLEEALRDQTEYASRMPGYSTHPLTAKARDLASGGEGT